MKSDRRIAIVIGSNIHWAPYYKRYEKFLENHKIKYDLILWNREHLNEDVKADKLIEYKEKDVSDNKNPFKIIKFIRFSNFVKKVLNKHKYEKIIFLGTHGCAPVFLANYLKRKYKNKYWLDIRDYQYEWFKPFYYLENISIKNSYATTISSKGYEEFLPQFQYYYMHNIDPNMETLKKEYSQVDNDKRIRISFIGNVRYYEENLKVIKRFANDERFVLQYFGAGSEKIQKYCDENQILNVKTSGRFEAKETVKFYNSTDIINNVYGNNQVGLTTALSNKLYYAVNLKLPILVCSDTYMEKMTVENNFGFVFEDEEKFPDKLFENYKIYKDNENIAKYDMIWEQIKKEDDNAINKLKEFLKK